MLRVALPDSITTNAASILLDGVNSQFYRDSATTDALSGLNTISSTGMLSLQNGRSFLPGSNFTNAGSLIIGAGSTFGRSPANATAPTSGLIAFYPGQGNANDATGRHPGTLQGGLGFEAGISGQAFALDGIDDSVDLGTWFNLNSFSIGLWVNPGTTQQAFADIMDNNHTGSQGWVMQQNGGTTNQFVWGVTDGNSGSIPLFNFTPNTWQHILVTREAATSVNSVYLIGTLIGSSTGANNINYAGSQFFRLGRWGGGGRNWNGRMDEVRVYDRPLNAGEVVDLAAVFGSGTFTQTGGSVLLRGGTLSTPTGPLTILGGTISGAGTIKGNVLNNSVFTVGSPLGQIAITGDYTQSVDGVFNVDLSGLTAGTQFDQLNIAGATNINGIANVSFLNGFAPVNGDNFAIINFKGRTGQFSAINGLPATMRSNYSGTSLTLVSEQRGIHINPTLGLQTTEAGGTASFTMVLDSRPTSNVTIGLTSTDTAEGTLSTSQVVFTPENWNAPQTVTITGVDDFFDDDNVAYSIVTAPAVSTDSLYNGFDASDIQLTNLNNDTAGFTITPNANLITTESGGTATFSVVLTSIPLANVLLTLFSNKTNEGTASPSPLLFTPINWNVTQMVTVQGVDDQVVDGDVAYTIVTNPASSTDAKYNQLNPIDIGVTNSDNDLLDLQVANLAMSPATGLQSGNNLNLAWKVNNTGTVATPGVFYDYITIKNSTTGETLLNNSHLIYDPSAAGAGAIQPGGSRDRLFNYRIPDGIRGVGQIEVTITTDGRNDILEANATGTAEANNSDNRTQSSSLALSPDLRVINLNVTPESLQSGNSIHVSRTDLNAGSGSVNASFQDGILVKNLTTDQVLVFTNVAYDVNANGNGVIAAGDSRSQSYHFRLPDGLAGVGQIQFTITTDSGSSIFESEVGGVAESNNSTSITKNSDVAAYPDLQVTNFRTEPIANISSGNIVTIRWDDTNLGTSATNASWSDGIVIRNTTTNETLVQSSVPYEPATAGNGVIATGTSRTRQFSYRIPE